MRELPSPRWAADPYGRHEMRYWDGGGWTAHVSDRGVTAMDAVPGLAVGAAVASTAGPATAEPSTTGPAGSGQQGALHDEPTLAIPAATASTEMPTMTAPTSGGSARTAPAASVDALFGATRVSAKTSAPSYRRAPAPSGRRNGLVIGVSALAITGIVAGVLGFSGLPDPGSDSVTPVAGPATTTGPEPTTSEPEAAVTEEPTMYGGPTTSAVDEPVASPAPPPRTTTTKPRASTKPRTTTSTRPPTRTLPGGLVRYPGCQVMRQDYPHGVGRPGARDRRNGGGGDRVRNFTVNGPLYAANIRLDYDGDGIACEA